MVLFIGFLLTVSLALSAALAALGRHMFADAMPLLEAINFFASLAVITVLFAMIYKILPNVTIGWRDVWVGAAITALLFTVGKLLIGLYIGKSSVASSFGAAGPFVVILVWIYYSTQIFLLGAEFTAKYAQRRRCAISGAGAGSSLAQASSPDVATSVRKSPATEAFLISVRRPSPGNLSNAPVGHQR
jgi:membrane protein